MKITDLHINGFGIWSELSVSDLSENVTVVFGRNEAGKTTLLQFIRTVLYGFSPKRIERYLPPVYGGLAGGAIYIASTHGNFEIQRHQDPNSDTAVIGEPALTDEKGNVHGQAMLDKLLCDVDESIFNNVFAVGLREIQHLGTLNDTEAAEHLYNLSTGLDRVSLNEVLTELNVMRRKILAPDGEPSEISTLYRDHERLEAEIEELSQQGIRWSRLGKKRQKLEATVTDLEKQIKRFETEAEYVEIATRVIDPWKERLAIEQQLAALGVPASVDGTAFDRLDKIQAEIERRRRQYKNIKRKQANLRKEADALPVNRSLFANIARIEACGEHLQWIPSLERQIGHLESETNLLSGQLESSCHAAGIPFDDSMQTWPEINHSTHAILAGPAEEMRRALQEREDAIRERDQISREADQQATQLNRTMSQQNHSDIAGALEAAGEKVSQIRRRIQIDERLEKLERTRKELDCDIDDLLEEQVLPVRNLIGIGVPFVLGVMLVLIGFFWTSSALFGWPLAILGFCGLGIAIAIKYSMEGRITRELESCRHQIERVHEKLDQTKSDRDELDAVLEDGEGPLDIRLKTAERELERIEELLPMEAQRDDTQERNQLAKQRVIKLTGQSNEAHRRWVNVLRAANLPIDATPEKAHEIIDAYEQVREIWQRRKSRREELETRKQEFDSICGRIEQLSNDAGLEIAHLDPKAQLRFLLNSASDQTHVTQQREELVQRHNKYTTRRKRCLNRIKQLEQQHREFFGTVGVKNEFELRQLVEQNTQVRQLRGDHARVMQQMAATIGENRRASEIEQLLKEFDRTALEQCWENITGEVERCKASLTELHQQRGEMTQELRTLSQDRRYAAASLDLSCVEQKLKDAVRRWQKLAVVSLLVEDIQKKYETERQPETLRKASAYLEQMTNGKYIRVSTPLGENKLRVTDSNGKPLPVEVLSRGTREALFLSLRLALVAMYTKRKVTLPLVLDDVMVNFDGDRAKATAETLRDYAKSGRQLIVFTCHEHIVNLFKSVGAEIRHLPDHSELAKSVDIEKDVATTDKSLIIDDDSISGNCGEGQESESESRVEVDRADKKNVQENEVTLDDEYVDTRRRVDLPHAVLDSPQIWWDNSAKRVF